MAMELTEKIILTNIPDYEVRDADCENLCYKALANGISRILVGPSSLDVVKQFKGRGLRMGVSIAYPSGAVTPELKIAEMEDCLASGDAVDEFFVTCAEGYFMSGHEDNLVKEMTDIVKAAGSKPVYFIIECTALSEEQTAFLVKTATEAGVKGLLISTAFRPYDTIRRPEVEDIRKMRELAGDDLEIIAAGCIRSEEDAASAIAAGADSVMIDITDDIVGV